MEPQYLSSRELRQAAGRIVDALGAYWDGLEGLPLQSRVSPGDILRLIPGAAPERGDGSLEGVLDDLDRVVMPGLTQWQSPNFYAYFPSNISTPAVLAELLAAGLGQQGMLWATSPACTELEMRMMDWIGRAIGLPEAFLFGEDPAGALGGGVIQGTASESTLSALVAARHRSLRRLADRVERRAALPRLRVFTTSQAHSSVIKAAVVAGLALDADDHEQVRMIRTDGSYAMCPEDLEAQLRRSATEGHVPCLVVATVGSTGSTAVDPVDKIAGVIRACGPGAGGGVPWLHVDAAHSGAACICPEFRWMLRGVEHADSICFNPHKWLLTNFDCDCFWTRDRAALTASMSVTPEYLRNPASQGRGVVDYRDWHIPLGRRFRALKMWFVMRRFGLEGLRAHVREHVRLAELFEGWVRGDGRFEVATPRTVNLVCFRLRPGPGQSPAAADAANADLLNAVNRTGRAFLSHTVLPEVGGQPARYVLRMAIGAVTTRERHVREAWDLIRGLAGATPPAG
jgi:aromatic-L-amino-acid/L-tryptophan decarboxylase